jgi:release factor glutamine methyltransferase
VTAGWLAQAVGVLERAGVPSPLVDVELLAEQCTGTPRARVRELDDPGEQFWSLLARRAAREPLQHLVGRAWFRHVELRVGPGVFVPRPETEVVAGAAVTEAARVARSRAPVVVDLGTGSGAIALSVQYEVPGAHVHAVELDPGALAWARVNLAGTPVHLHEGDLADALPELDGVVDVVVSNPPYIPPDAVPRDPEVRDHDPPRALYGADGDGLGHLRAVVTRAAALLRADGLLVVEHADTQAAAVAALVDDASWAQVAAHLDLAGRPRYVTARRTGAS